MIRSKKGKNLDEKMSYLFRVLEFELVMTQPCNMSLINIFLGRISCNAEKDSQRIIYQVLEILVIMFLIIVTLKIPLCV